MCETSTKGIEEASGCLGGQFDGPSRDPAISTVNDVVEILKVAWVAEERRNKVNLVVSGKLIDELGLPAVDGRAAAEGAGFSGKGGSKDSVVMLQLVWMVGVACDVITEHTGVLRGGAWQHTAFRSSWQRSCRANESGERIVMRYAKEWTGVGILQPAQVG